MKRNLLPLLTAFFLLVTAGCPEPEQVDKGPAGPPPGTRLRVLVVDDQSLARSIGYLQSEWEAQSGVALEIEDLPVGTFDLKAAPAADVVIVPSWMLGPATQAGWVVPLPDQVLQDDESDWSDIFPQIRSYEVAPGRKPMGVPFGSPVPVLYYRPDVLSKAGVKVPATWADYRKVAGALGDLPTAEPLAEGWAGLTLLAHAAPYVTHPDNLSTLFRIDTMEPLIASPPFVRALEELVATSDVVSLDMDPAAVRIAFWQGKAAMAVTWPTAADESLAEIEPNFPAGVSELPGSPDVYDVGESAWEKRDKDSDGRIPLLASAGRLGMVTTGSRWPDASLQLLLWLTDETWSTQVCSQSPNTTLFRNSHLASVVGWTDPPMPEDAVQQYGEAVATALGRQQRLFALPIAGRPQYLAALDEAVRAAVRKEKPAQEALTAAAAKWAEITESLGVEEQKAAYQASLGLK